MNMVRLEAPTELAMPIGEAMFSQRAIRRLDSDRPITDQQLKTIMDAGSKAPNGGNVQPGRFLIIRDAEKIRLFGELYREAWWAKRRDDFGWTGKQDIPEGSTYRLPALLADEMSKAPVVILAFTLKFVAEEASIYPAVQNVLLAARALGIGSVLTTLHADVLERVYTMFAVPEDVKFHCCIPLGYPRGAFGPTSRYSTSETTYWDDWGTQPPR